MARNAATGHRREDPADRFLTATAQVLTLVTATARLIASTEYAVMAN